MVLSTMDQSSDLLNSLSDFAQSPTSDVPPDLEVYLTNVSHKGVTNAPWHLVKPLVRVKLESAIDSFLGDTSTASIDDYYPRPNMENFQLGAYRNSVLSTLDEFTNAPFTIQRVCELALSPSKHYRRVDKFLRGLLKCLSVVSCIDPNGQKIVFDQDEEEMTLPNSADSDSGAVASASAAAAAAVSVSSIADSANASDQAAGDSMSGDDELEASGSGSGSERSVPVGIDTPTPAEVDEDDEIESDSSSGCGASAPDAAVAEAVGSEISISEAVVAGNTPPVFNVASNSHMVATDSDSDVVVSNPDVVVSNPDNVVSNSDVVVSNLDNVVSNSDVVVSNSHVLVSDSDVVASNSDVVSNSDIVVSNSDVVVSNSDAFFTEVVASTCETANQDGVVLQTDEDKDQKIDEAEVEAEAEVAASSDNAFDCDPSAEGAIDETGTPNESESPATD